MRDVKVDEVMTHLVVTLAPTDTLHEAARRLARNHISGAPVVEHGKVVGIISESDLIKALSPTSRHRRLSSVLDWLEDRSARHPTAEDEHTVQEAMSRLVVQIELDAGVWEAADLMLRRGINRLPVVDGDGYLMGIISRADLVRAMGRDDESIRKDVVDAIGVLGEDALKAITISVNDGRMTLAGQTDRRSTKEIAVRLAKRVPGVSEVVDLLVYRVDDRRLRMPTQRERAPFLAGQDLNEHLPMTEETKL